MLNAKEIGKESMLNYVNDRISKGSTPLHVPIKKLKLKTFGNTQIKNTKAKAKIGSLKSDCDLFSKLMVISKERSVDLQHLFKFELSGIPLAIAEEDGSLAKTNKTQTLRDIGGKTESTVYVEEFQDLIRDVFIDHMACVQKLISRAGIETFGDL